MVAHHVVGISEDARDETATPERCVHAIGDVHVHFHAIAEPRITVFAGFGREHVRVLHGQAQPLERLPQPVDVGGRPERQLCACMQRIFQDRHPDAGLALLVIMLIQKDEKLRQRPRRIVCLHTIGERREVSVDHLCERSCIERAGSLM